MDNFRPVFASICKIDEDQRMVFGYASTEQRDQQGEVIRRAAIEAALPAYMNFANIREMHQPSAVGTAKEAMTDDKGLWLGAKIVDDSAWLKCKSGVYKGFSVGGRVTARDTADRSIITGIELSEISLVDRPANPEAIFEIVKRARTGEMLLQPLQKWDCGCTEHQHSTKSEAATCMAHEAMKAAMASAPKVLLSSQLVKFADGSWTFADGTGFFGKRDFSDKEREHAVETGAAMSDGGFPIENGEDLENAIQAVGRAKDYAKAKAHIIARAKALDMAGKLPSDWEGSTKKEDVAKSQPQLSTGRFATHADAAKESQQKAADHQAGAAKARKDETTSRAKAEKAKAAGDARAFALHDHLAGTAASLAEQHDQAAAIHAELASRHEAQASTSKKGNHMPKSQLIDDAAKKASTAMGALLALVNDVAKEAINHADEAAEAREAAMSHEQTALAHEGKAAESRENAAKAKKAGDMPTADGHQAEAEEHEQSAAHHHRVADNFHDLHAHHLQAMGGGDNATAAEKATAVEIVKFLKPQIDKCENVAKAHDAFVTIATSANDDKALKHHTALSKSYRESATAKAEVLKRAEAFEKLPMVEGQRTTSEADPNGKGSGKNPDMPAGPSLGEQHQTTTSDTDPNGKGSGKNPPTVALNKGDLSMECPKCKAVMPKLNEACQSCGEPLHKREEKKPGAEEEDEGVRAARKVKKVAAVGSVEKGLNIVMDLAGLIMHLRNLAQSSAIEQIMEGDTDDPSPAKLKELCEEVVRLLSAVVTRETEELLSGTDEEVAVINNAVVAVHKAASPAELAKMIEGLMTEATVQKGIGTKHITRLSAIGALFKAAGDEEIAKASAKMKCEDCGHMNAKDADKCAGCGEPMGGAQKMAKVAKERDDALAALDRNTTAIAEMMRGMQKRNSEVVLLRAENVTLKKANAALESLPIPSRAKAIVVPLHKGADIGNGDTAADPSDPFAAIAQIADPRERNEALLKVSYVPRVGDGLRKVLR